MPVNFENLSVWKNSGRKLDPRWLQIFALGLYGFVARFFYGFERSYSMMLWLVLLSLVFDIVLSLIILKRFKNPLSSIIVGLGVGFLIDTPVSWIYPVCVFAGVASKFIIRDKNTHFFNPGNFAVVFGLIAFPGVVSPTPGMFGDSLTTLYLFIGLGLVVAWYAKQLLVSVGSLVLFLFFAWVRSVYFHLPFDEVSGPIFSPAVSLFCFHMVTDAATIPKNTRGKLLFIVALAAIDAYLRTQRVALTQLMALFILGNFRLIYILLRDSLEQRQFEPVRVLLFAPALLGSIGYSTRIGRVSWGKPAAEQISYLDLPADVKVKARNDLRFEDVSSTISPENLINHVPKIDPALQPWVRWNFIAPGVSVFDLDGDQFRDFIVFDSVKGGNVYLGMNVEGKQFKNVAKEWGLATGPKRSIPQSVTPFDYNKDGRIDLLVSGPGCLTLYKNSGNKFVDVSDETGISKICLNTIMAIPWDFNHDRETDLLLTNFYRPEFLIEKSKEYTFDFGPNSWSNATNGGREEILIYQNGKFTIDRSLFNFEEAQFSWDSSVSDINGDSKPEIVLANDWGRDRYFEMESDHFVDRTDNWTAPEWRSGMSVTPLYFDEGNPHWMITNAVIYPLRVKGSFVNGYEKDTGKIEDSAFAMGLHDCGWAWGAVGGDFDLDGDQDVYVANGFITKIPEEKVEMLRASLSENEFQSAIFTSIPPKVMGKLTGLPAFKSADPTKNFSGLERDCIFENKDSSFHNVSLEAGITKYWDGRAVVTTDFNNDGLADLIVTSQEGEIHFLQNYSQVKGHFVYVSLRDEDHNPIFGTKIIVEQNGHKQRRDYSGGKSGFLAFSDTRMHFGLKDDAPVTITVTWPEGKTKSFSSATDKICDLVRSRGGDSQMSCKLLP